MLPSVSVAKPGRDPIRPSGIARPSAVAADRLDVIAAGTCWGGAAGGANVGRRDGFPALSAMRASPGLRREWDGIATRIEAACARFGATRPAPDGDLGAPPPESALDAMRRAADEIAAGIGLHA